MSDDDRMDEMLRELARSYHEPPPTPREEMWERIAAARAGSAQARVPSRRLPWWLGLAAALLLGVAIGRLAWMPAGPTGGTQAAQPQFAAAPESVSPDAPALPEERATVADPVGDDLRSSPLAVSRPPASTTRQPAREEVARRAPRGTPADVAGLYRYVAYETLGQAEALLTIFRSEENREARGRVAAWARDVLTSTRLLLDSPAADDQQLASLLRDLELVLTQIVALDQVAGTESEAGERELIDEAIRERDVIPRLRTTIPVGLQPAGAS